jgi:hypothetical protein
MSGFNNFNYEGQQPSNESPAGAGPGAPPPQHQPGAPGGPGGEDQSQFQPGNGQGGDNSATDPNGEAKTTLW